MRIIFVKVDEPPNTNISVLQKSIPSFKNKLGHPLHHQTNRKARFGGFNVERISKQGARRKSAQTGKESSLEKRINNRAT